MTKRLLHPYFRIFVSPVVLMIALVFFSGINNELLAAGAPLQAGAQAAKGPKIWLQDNQAVPVTHVGSPTITQLLSAGKGQPLSMTSGDFNEDGVSDLLVGYSTAAGGAVSLQRGNLDALAPQSDASFQGIIHGQFPQPFLPGALVLNVPVTPDFLAAGNFTGKGHLDFVAASRGGNTLYLFEGDGKGNFAAPVAISVQRNITALAATNFGLPQHFDTLFAGLSSPDQTFSLALLDGSPQGPAVSTSFSLSAAVSTIAFGDLDGDSKPDAAILAGGQVFVLHGASAQMETLALPVSPTALTVGSFIFDRDSRAQIALLTADGSVHIAAHASIDSRPFTTDETMAMRQATVTGMSNPVVPAPVADEGWKIVESFPAAISAGSASQAPVLVRTRISSNAADDVMVLNGFAGQMTVITHPNLADSATSFVPGQVSTRPYAGSPVAALPMRVNIDGRPGIVALHSGQVAPAVMMPLPDPTFVVNTTNDTLSPGACAAATAGQCSLREAITEANATAGVDTITVPAGTYTLTITNATANGENANATGDLDITDGVNIVGAVDGAGNPTTIIQAGPSAGTGIDKVFSVNPLFNKAFDTAFSNLEIRFGKNLASFGTNGFGGGFDWEGSHTGNMTVTNCNIHDNTLADGSGGGITITNTGGGTGRFTMSTSTVSNNVAQRPAGNTARGGGIFIGSATGFTITNTHIDGNQALTSSGEGGGVFIFNPGTTPISVIHGGSFSGNQAAVRGGGIRTTAGITVDQGTVISNNTAPSGAGVWSNLATSVPFPSGETTTLSNVTITGNTASTSGGGVQVDTSTPGNNLTMSFSRLAGNSAPTGSNLNNLGGAITATDNWWGTNNASSTINTTAGTTTFDPFIVLSHTASPSTIKINQSTTLTASFLQDNHGTTISVANLAVLLGLPITFNNPVDGTVTGAQTSIQNTGTATATFNAGNVAGGGKADAVVDQATVTANIIVLEPLRIVKSFNPTTVAVNASSTLTFSVDNPNVIAVDASFTDTFPANMVVAATPAATNTCGGTFSPVAGAGSVSFTNAALPVGTCTITVAVKGTTDGVFSNSVTIDSTAAGTGALSTSSASLTVINPPTIAKAFGAATIPLNGTTSLTFTLSSTNANLTLNGVAFTDTLPSGLIVATPSGLTSTCSGTATAVAGSSSASLSGASLAPGASCTISLNVTGTTAGVKNNSVQATSTNAGAGNTSNASITVVAPPVIIKAFGAASIPLNGSTSLTFTIQNNNTTVSLTGVGFSDTLPAGLVVSTPNGLTGSCGGGTITATQGTNVISLSGATLAQSTSCTFAVNVTGTAAGQQNNTTGNVTSTEGGTGGTASASVIVVAPPSIAKAFGAATIPLNGTTSLTFTITNPAANTVAETGVAFTDTLPTGLVVATPNGLSNTCGGIATAVAGSTSISLTGGTIAVNTSCTLVVNITGTVSGSYINTSGAVSSTNGGTGNTATASLIVAAPPTITKAFGAASIPLNGSTSLTFTIQNPNTGITLNGVAFTDTLPAGLVVATPNALSNTCGGTATAVAGSGSVSLSGGTVASSASCTVSIDVTGTTAGVKNNSVQVTSTEGGTGNTSNASITVVAPPVIIKAFGAASISLNGSTSLTFTIQNNNTGTTLTGIGFSDTLPAGLVVSTPNGLTGTCGGGTITATQATNVISLTSASLAQSTSCTFAVNVTGTTAGTKNNTTGNVTSTEGGTGGTASASINVVAPPSIAKAFGAAAVPLNGTTSLTFTITNPAANAVAETGVAFTDTLPAGLVVATPNGLTNTCGGTATAVAGSGSISLTGGTIAASSTCTLTVNITGTASGNFVNTTGNVTSTNGGTGNTATANLSVATPPTITKAFGAASIPLNGSTSLTFTITNPAANTIGLTSVAFTDNLPAGLVVATPNGLTSTCGGTTTAVAGSGSISLSGGTLAVNTSCTISANVTGTTAGVKNNSVQVTSLEGGAGNTSNASITVVAPPVIIKAFGAAGVPLNGSTSLTFTIQNNNTTTTLTGIGFSDTLPAGLVVSTPNGLTGTCGGGTITATQATGVISLSGASLAQSTSCTFAVNVTGTTSGTKNNTTGNVTSTEGGTGGTASASVSVEAPPSIAKAFGAPAVPLNGTTSLTFTITNPAANTVAETGVAFTDTLPAGLVVATPNGLTNTCGGTATAVAGSGSISLTGGTIAASSTCTLTVNITGTASGNFINTTGNVTSTNGGTGNTATANLSVATPPTITKLFGAAAIPLNGSTSLTFTITNPASNTIALTSVAFTDNLPAGLVVATPNGLTSTCGGTATAVAGSGSISLSGGALAVNTSCTISVNITGTTAGVKNNSVQVTSLEGGTGNTSNASITVVGPPVIIKAFGAASVPLNGSTSLTFTIQNNNTTTTLTGIGFSDTLPAGLVISTPNGLTGSCGGGAITATQATSVISLSGASLAASTSCTFAVNVTGTTGGTKNNTTGNVTSTEGGTGGTASASLSVEAPPSIAKAFNPTVIAVNGTSTLTLTITNPAANVIALTGVAVTDNLPAGLVVATPNGLTNTCGGTATATAGSSSVSLTGGTIATSSNCALTVNVTAAAAGSYVNTTGSVSSTNGGTGNTATATLTIQPADLTITKVANGPFSRGQTGATYTITVNNIGVGPTIGTVTVADTLPAVVHTIVPTALSGTGWTCTLGTLTCTRADVLAPGASYPAITLTVNIPINIQNTFTNTVTVSGGGETNTGNDTGTSTVTLGPPIVITPHSNTITVAAGNSGTLVFDVASPDPTLGVITFTCTGLPPQSACAFNPATIDTALGVTPTTVTMTVTTTATHTASLTRPAAPLPGGNGGGNSPLYAALLPVLGLLGLASVGRKGRKARLKLTLCLVLLVALLAMIGCGVGPQTHTIPGTPAGTSTVTITAASPGFTATSTVSLTVQ